MLWLTLAIFAAAGFGFSICALLMTGKLADLRRDLALMTKSRDYWQVEFANAEAELMKDMPQRESDVAQDVVLAEAQMSPEEIAGIMRRQISPAMKALLEGKGGTIRIRKPKGYGN